MSDSFWVRWWKAKDRALNVDTGGDDDETISHRVARARARGVWWGSAACWLLDKVKYISPDWEDHCGKVLADPNKADATIPIDAPLFGDANPNKEGPCDGQ